MPDSSDNVNSGARASGSVDWSRPIEAVHESGGVFPVVVARKQFDGDYLIAPTLPEGFEIFGPDGSSWSDGPWRIRNVQPTTPELDPALWDRMVALCRLIASAPIHLEGPLAREARAIVADLTKPVDPDLIEARNVVMQVHIARGMTNTDRTDLDAGKHDDEQPMLIALAAIKRGRELVQGERA